ncbi:MAG: glucose-6-phosphate isomerase, partial [Luminiphilus sp.]
MAITPTALHDALTQAAEALRSQPIEGLFDTTPDRASGYRCEAAGLTLDYSKHLLDDDAWQTLSTLVDTYALPAAFASLIGGEIVNTSEHRPALHTLLRGTASDQHPEKSKEIEETLSRMAALVESIHSGASTGDTGKRFTDVVNLGIGGSDLGPRLVCEALH